MCPPLCGWPVDRPGPVTHCAEPACIVYLVQVADAPVQDTASTQPAGLFLCLAHDPAQLAAPAVRWLDANGRVATQTSDESGADQAAGVANARAETRQPD